MKPRGKRRRKRGRSKWLWENRKRNCYYCNVRLARFGWSDNRITGDHKKALGVGGYDKRKNVVACCRACNQAKGTMDAEAFRQRVIAAAAHHPA